jgi:hypothetical protein
MLWYKFYRYKVIYILYQCIKTRNSNWHIFWNFLLITYLLRLNWIPVVSGKQRQKKFLVCFRSFTDSFFYSCSRSRNLFSARAVLKCFFKGRKFSKLCLYSCSFSGLEGRNCSWVKKIRRATRDNNKRNDRKFIFGKFLRYFIFRIVGVSTYIRIKWNYEYNF